MISHDHRCIFTRVPKTAGKSVRFLLFGLPEFEHEYTGGAGNISHAYGHWRLSQFAGEPYFAEYFKFSFVRNPFDRLVSAFFYLDAGGCNAADAHYRKTRLARYRGSFAAFVEDLPRHLEAPHFRPQSAWLCDDRGQLLTDFVGRCETLRGDVEQVAARLGLSLGEMPHLNASRHAPYQSCYDDASKRRVAQVYGEDIERFAYRFEPALAA